MSYEEDRAAKIKEKSRIPSDQELAEMLEAAKRQGIFLRKTPHVNDTGAPGCWLGGAPTLPADIDWPWYEDRGVKEAPMHFMAQIDLAQVPRVDGLPEFPATGTLFFFFDPMIAPARDTMPHSGQVIYVDSDVSALPPRQMPDLPVIENEEEICYFFREKPTHGYVKRPITFEPVEMIEDDLFHNNTFSRLASRRSQEIWERKQITTERDRRNLRWADKGYSGAFAFHHLFGDGSQRGYAVTDRTHTPLLAMPSDGDLGFGYGDSISIVYWISPEDLASGRFEHAYVAERNY